MKHDEVDTLLSGIDPPHPEHLRHQAELKIPLLSYKKSSRAGLWLLALPAVVAATVALKYEVGMISPVLDGIRHFFAAVDGHPVFTYLIPLIAVGLPTLAMTMNLLAFCHVAHVREKREFIVTLKIRPLNITLFLLSCAVLVYFFLPDRLSF